MHARLSIVETSFVPKIGRKGANPIRRDPSLFPALQRSSFCGSRLETAEGVLMHTSHAVSQHTSLTAAAEVDPHASSRPSPKYGLKHPNIAGRRPRLRADDATHTMAADLMLPICL